MNVLETKLYHFKRSRVHRAMAAVAASETARRTHTELAERYASKAEDVPYQPSALLMPCLDGVIASKSERRITERVS